MSKPTNSQIQQLISSVIIPFYHVKRDTPLPIGERRWENDAEHSWSLAFLACALAPEVDKRLDLGLICQFAVVHDLVEVYADDTSNFAHQSKLDTKAEREAQALKLLEQQFKHFPWIVKTIERYERKDTDEAKFVYALDKCLPVYFDYLDNSKLFRERKMTLADYTKALESHRKKAHSHPEIGKYYEKVRTLVEQHPEYFHQDVK
jgi:5'-deoxynucleotidase YfbR-like HD superfamily hydrolase